MRLRLLARADFIDPIHCCGFCAGEGWVVAEGQRMRWAQKLDLCLSNYQAAPWDPREKEAGAAWGEIKL